jgi:hypothetical protein
VTANLRIPPSVAELATMVTLAKIGVFAKIRVVLGRHPLPDLVPPAPASGTTAAGAATEGLGTRFIVEGSVLVTGCEEFYSFQHLQAKRPSLNRDGRI